MVRKASTGLGAMQSNVLTFVAQYSKRMGVPPSIREIADAVRPAKTLSTSVVNYYLDQLERFGYVERQRHISRGLTVTEKGWVATGYRKVGSLVCPHCGKPIDADVIGAEIVKVRDGVRERPALLVGVQ